MAKNEVDTSKIGLLKENHSLEISSPRKLDAIILHSQALSYYLSKPVTVGICYRIEA